MKLRYYPFFLLTILIALLRNPAYCQFGPNLSAGASGLVYDKGALDSDLILSIISTKKGEIKSELGKRIILNRLEGASYALYNYADKNLHLLFNESNKEVITKEFLKNSAELALVYSVAEYYLRYLNESKSLTPEEETLLTYYKKAVASSDPALAGSNKENWTSVDVDYSKLEKYNICQAIGHIFLLLPYLG